jgi:hypothetical protein
MVLTNFPKFFFSVFTSEVDFFFNLGTPQPHSNERSSKQNKTFKVDYNTLTHDFKLPNLSLDPEKQLGSTSDTIAPEPFKSSPFTYVKGYNVKHITNTNLQLN